MIDHGLRAQGDLGPAPGRFSFVLVLNSEVCQCFACWVTALSLGPLREHGALAAGPRDVHRPSKDQAAGVGSGLFPQVSLHPFRPSVAALIEP